MFTHTTTITTVNLFFNFPGQYDNGIYIGINLDINLPKHLPMQFKASIVELYKSTVVVIDNIIIWH